MKDVRKTWWITIVLAAVIAAGGCSEGKAVVEVDLFGWHDGTFLNSLADYPGADEVEIRVTRPDEGEEMTVQTHSIDAGGAELPELDSGAGVRMDFEVRDAGGDVIAFGATPVFETGTEAAYNRFRTQIAAINDFAPVGAAFGEEGDEHYTASRFDDVSLNKSMGRLGHTAHPTTSGDVIAVGGARISGEYEPFHKPNLSYAFDDIQVLEVGLGFFTELGGEYGVDDGPVGEDRLEVARAFHTVTPLGDDRFVVAGGFGADGQPVSELEMIDLNADEGDRVQMLNASLSDPRGMHTATFRASDGTIVVAGGIGTGDSVVDTIEVIDPDAQTVQSGISMSSARVGHAAVLLEDGESVWLVGGRDGTSILDRTELVEIDGGSTISRNSHRMDRRRYGASIVHLGAAGNNRVLIIGGFTSDAGATASYEVGNPLQIPDIIAGGDFGYSWDIDDARGGATAMKLPQSGEVVVIGGYDNNRSAVPTAERFAIDLEEVTGPLVSVDEEMGSMFERRRGYAASSVNNGRIAFIGGLDPAGNGRDTAEYFTPYDPVGR